MIELNKENVCIGEKSSALFSQAYCEADVIVPDIFPDISKIIQATATAVIEEKNYSKGHININGKAEIIILYTGHDEKTYSISTSQPFNHTIDAKEMNEGAYTDTEITVDNINYTVLNSRKLSLKVLMGIDANICETVYADMCTFISTDEPYQMLEDYIKPYRVASRNCEQLCIREKLELPNGNPSIEKILRVDVNIRNKEYYLSENKMVIKGMLLFSTVYSSDMDGLIHCAEHEIPFAEAISMPDATEDMKPHLKLSASRIFYKPESDSDGDCRYIIAECIITANAKACQHNEIRVVKDSYCTEYPVSIERETAVVTELVCDNTCQISCKDVASLEHDMPEIMQIFNINPKVFLSTAKTDKNKIIIEGIIESDIMYISEDSKKSINTFKHQQPFSYTIDALDIHEDMLCDVHLDIIHSSYTIALGREIELRYVLQAEYEILHNKEIKYIVCLSRDDSKPIDKRKSFCIKIYFAKKHDNLWSIAKRHCITQQALMEINNIYSDKEIYDGKQLMIPIK